MSRHYAVLKFDHANLKREVEIVAGTISAFHESRNEMVCNVIYTTAGIFPVTNSLEEIRAKIEGLDIPVTPEIINTPPGQGETSGQ